MFDFIEGEVEKLKADCVVLNVGGIGYLIHISLATYDEIKKKSKLRLFIHQIIKEDSHTLYGFANDDERVIFKQLISVSGIGSNTARLILSSLKSNDLIMAIINGNVALISSIKGIGPKTAQRMVLELKDKVGKLGKSSGFDDFGGVVNNSSEALQALIALGFAKIQAEKALQKAIAQSSNNESVEMLIKNSLKLL